MYPTCYIYPCIWVFSPTMLLCLRLISLWCVRATTVYVCQSTKRVYRLMKAEVCVCLFVSSVSDFVPLMSWILMAVRHYQAAICVSDLWTCVFPWVPKRGEQVKQTSPHYSIMEKACPIILCVLIIDLSSYGCVCVGFIYKDLCTKGARGEQMKICVWFSVYYWIKLIAKLILDWMFIISD